MLTGRFEEQVKKNPQKMAIKTKDEEITYEQLNNYANGVAKRIIELSDTRYRLSERELIRYKRQLLIHNWGIEGQKKLKQTTVFVAGAGGSGSPLLIQLALCGIGTIIVCDFDQVELSNLNRQCLHDESRIGMNKALSAKLSLSKINPNVKVIARTERITRENIDELVGDSCFIFDNVDDLETKFVLSESAVRKGIPHAISSMIDINSYAAIFHSPHTPCFHCLYDKNKLQEIADMRRYASTDERTPNPVASPSLFLSTAFVCNEALKIIFGFENPAYNKYFYFNQRASNELVKSDGHLIITYPFSDYFKKISKDQGFDWDGDWRGKYVEELDIVHNPDCPLCSEGAKAREVNKVDYIKEVASTSEEVASTCEEVDLSIADQEEQQVIALLFDHGADMLVGLMGALKTGNIYLPLDSSYPEKRLSYMLKNSGATLIVTNDRNYSLANRLVDKAKDDLKVLNITEINPKANYQNINLGDEGEKMAYILYTSGSTGNPKGVVQSRENIWHFIENYIKIFDITEDDRLTLLSAFGHDAAVMDIYSAFLSGGTIYPINIKDEFKLTDLKNWLNEEKITIFHSVPTVFRYFMETLRGKEDFPYLKKIILGGEGVLEHDLKSFKENFKEGVVLANLYGQSESSYNSTKFFTHDSPEKITLGETIDGVEIFLLDEEGEEVDPLEIGEIVVASKHIALGYWNDPEKSAEVITEDEEFGRLYWTGDLGRLQLDGQIEYVGRKDFQVKVRGFRVELSEIENQLLEHLQVKEAVVIAKDDPTGTKELTAYLVTRGEVLEGTIRNYLANTLPDYMVPAHIAFIEKMPLTSTNKIDRKALAGMEFEIKQSQELVLPATSTEEKLFKIWSDVLGTDKFGVTNNFLDVGGHSLKAVRVISLVNKEFGVELLLKDIFTHSTIRELARLIGTKDQKSYIAIEPAGERAYYPASSAQKRLFLLYQREGQSTGYNMPGVMKITGKLDTEKLSQAFSKLVTRHETLRTSFEVVDGEIAQKIHPDVEFAIENLDLTAKGNGLEVEELIKDFVKPFDLGVAPLLRVTLVKVGEDEHILMYDVHHIISDGISKGILDRDFINLYYDKPLPELKIQYKDYATWQSLLIETEKMEEIGGYWIEKLKDFTYTQLPETEVSSAKNLEGLIKEIELDQELTSKIREFCQNHNITKFTFLLAIFKIILAKTINQNDITLGIPVSGRNREELDKIIGIFLNIMILRTVVEKESSFREYLNNLKENIVESQDYLDYPYEMLYGRLKELGKVQTNSLFSIIFNYLPDHGNTDLELGGLSFVPYSLGELETKYNFTLYVGEGRDTILLKSIYRNNLEEQTIQKILNSFNTVIQTVLESEDILVNQISLTSEDKIEQYAQDFTTDFDNDDFF